MEVKIAYAYLSQGFVSYLGLLILVLKHHFSEEMFSLCQIVRKCLYSYKYMLLQACGLNSHFTVHVFALCFGGQHPWEEKSGGQLNFNLDSYTNISSFAGNDPRIELRLENMFTLEEVVLRVSVGTPNSSISNTCSCISSLSANNC